MYPCLLPCKDAHRTLKLGFKKKPRPWWPLDPAVPPEGHPTNDPDNIAGVAAFASEKTFQWIYWFHFLSFRLYSPNSLSQVLFDFPNLGHPRLPLHRLCNHTPFRSLIFRLLYYTATLVFFSLNFSKFKETSIFRFTRSYIRLLYRINEVRSR